MRNKIAITTGDPNGVGAEITVKALNLLDIEPDKIVIISNKKLLNNLKNDYEIIEIPLEEVDYGQVSAQAGEFAFQSLVKVCQIRPKAIVTAPVAKNALHLAGHNFNGQTEILQKYLAHDDQHAEMLFVANKFRVLLLTRHCALKKIKLTKEMVLSKILNLVNDLRSHFGIEKPRLALCGFNPHAGEDGILGNEEKDILIPAVKELHSLGVDISLPKPADTLFINAARHYLNNEADDYDCYIANYHDQGLIPIKTVAGIKTVNTTIGLDIIRTSPGHGTAFDIAGKNIADPTGMIEAIKQVL